MFKKILISEFLTTVNFNLFIKTIGIIIFRLPSIRYGKFIEIFENKLLQYIGVSNSKIISFYSGRNAIYHALKIIGIKKGEEVIVSGYTCVSVSNAVIQSGAAIIYSDIDNNTLGLDLNKLKSNITNKTKVIIVQHIFGKPSNINKIIKLAKSKNIIIIEDCAHSLGSEFKGRKLGSFGDFSIFSTGRDKVISSITGGFLIINNKDFFGKLEKIKSRLLMPSRTLVIRNLFYNIIGYISYKTYLFMNVGKIIIHLSRRLNIITEILSKKERKCNYNFFDYKFPNSLAILAIGELNKIKYYCNHRNIIAEHYDNNLNIIEKVFKKNNDEYNNYFRYPIICRNKKEKNDLIKYMKSNNILLGHSWSGTNIVPLGSNIKKAQYNIGSCKTAEKISKNILTLPNHNLISLKDVNMIVTFINKFKVKIEENPNL